MRQVARHLPFLLVLAVPAFFAASGTAQTHSGQDAKSRHGQDGGAAGTQPKAALVIKMSDGKYDPSPATVKVGDTVEWQNTGTLAHTVTDDPRLVKEKGDAVLPEGAKPFHSGKIQPGGTFRHTFTAAGTYKYFCVPHEHKGMLGTLIVEPAGGAHGSEHPGAGTHSGAGSNQHGASY